MKENKYDDKHFFEQYAQMARSKDGLAAAGEWPSLEKILPSFKDMCVLDLGCGYGWHSLYALDHGAASVVAVDISSKMLEVAASKIDYDNVEFINLAIEDINFEPNEFDIIISSLAMHYIEDYQKVIDKVEKILKPGGSFIMSVEHPIFTAEGSQFWIIENDQIKYFPVDNYFYEGKRDTNFLDTDITKYHRTITTYVQTLIDKDLIIKHVIEPMPPQHLMDVVGMSDEMRRPMMIIIRADKREAK